jgi:Purple acid Phosphatase, N-terminal domain
VLNEQTAVSQDVKEGSSMIWVSGSRLTIAIGAIAAGLLFVQPGLAFAGDGSSQVTARPEVESISDTLAFITWTTQNPGGTILHYAVVHYGKDPKHLDLTAESPTRINRGHSEMVFRVRVSDLQPATTYYYKVSSRQADGIFDPAASAVNQFTTRPPNRTRADK